MSGLSFDFGQAILSEYDEHGFIGLQIDHYGDNAGGQSAEAHFPYGFLSRPLDPDNDPQGQPSGATALWWYEGDRIHAMPLCDPRVMPKLPQLGKGGSMQYGATGSHVLIDPTTGAIAIKPVSDDPTAGVALGSNPGGGVATSQTMATMLSALVAYVQALQVALTAAEKVGTSGMVATPLVPLAQQLVTACNAPTTFCSTVTAGP